MAVHDPYILEDDLLPSEIKLSSNLDTVVKGASLIFISSDHKMYSKLTERSLFKAKKPLLVFDGRNIVNKNNSKKASLLTTGIREST